MISKMNAHLRVRIFFVKGLTSVRILYILFIYSKWRCGVNIFIDNKSGMPIYDQIYTQIKDQIIRGALPTDKMLPSIRIWQHLIYFRNLPRS